jgi:DNA helicase IV
VIVVEPAQIVAEGGEAGLRELFVALTRPTTTLVVTHAEPLPALLG